MENVRDTLDRLIRDRGEDYAALSRLIGRNPAYIQQFIHRGSPRKLAEDDRKLLARYLGVDESLLGGPLVAPVAGDLISVPRLAVEASAGPGALASREETISRFGFDTRWLRGVASAPQNVSAIAVRGESMSRVRPSSAMWPASDARFQSSMACRIWRRASGGACSAGGASHSPEVPPP